jgi:isopenicillin N synthase-like dioxygenase
MLQIWTNDVYKATLHRVVTSNKIRQSIAFCYEPNFDSILDPIEECLEGQVPKYSRVKYGTYVMSKMNSSFPQKGY